MFAMIDHPTDCMLDAFLRDETQHMLNWHEHAGVLYPNNGTSTSAPGCGYTDELPQTDHVPGTPARVKDMWGFPNRRDVGVSPEMSRNSCFLTKPDYRALRLSYYGCCEPVDARWPIVRRIRNLRAVSVSPWFERREDWTET